MHRRDPVKHAHLNTQGMQRLRISGMVRSGGPGSTAGTTVCGRPMLLEELWCTYEPEPDDPLCPDCFPARLTVV